MTPDGPHDDVQPEDIVHLLLASLPSVEDMPRASKVAHGHVLRTVLGAHGVAEDEIDEAVREFWALLTESMRERREEILRLHHHDAAVSEALRREVEEVLRRGT